jgi:chorismate dehydratase
MSMPGDDPLSKLRMAPRETLDEMLQRVEREKRARTRHRENSLEQSSIPYRIGSVPYLNAAPLTRGLEDQIAFMPPSQLALKLRAGELDAALVSVVEVLFEEGYDVLDGIAVASLGEVKSVFLAHRKPLAETRVIACDPASLTSVALLRVLLAEQGLKPELKPLQSYDAAAAEDAVLLIGNPALNFLRSNGGRERDQDRDRDRDRDRDPNAGHEIWDLGAAWFELTRLPFVYAVWALRRGIENLPLRQQLREARDFGLETLDTIIRDRAEYDYDFRKDYLGWHIHYHLGTDEKRGLKRFGELLRKHQIGNIHEPHFVV